MQEATVTLPPWDSQHLEGTLPRALADCSDAELEGIVDVFRCHRDEDLRRFCWDTETNALTPGCYAETSSECSSLATPSKKCIDGYKAHLDILENANASSTGPAVESVCADSLQAARLAQIAYDNGKVESALANAFGDKFTLDSTYAGEKTRGGLEGFGYVATAVEDSKTTCYAVFQGTANAVDWYEDFKAEHTTCANLNGQVFGGTSTKSCELGFYEVYEILRAKGMTATVHDMVKKNTCDGGLVIIGHSLGGALTSLLFADLHSLDATQYSESFVRTFTFGEPRTFTETVANGLETAVDKNRWTNWGDPVPKVPLTSMGYYHYGRAWEMYKAWFGDTVTFNSESQNFQPAGLCAVHHFIEVYIQRLELCPGGKLTSKDDTHCDVVASP